MTAKPAPITSFTIPAKPLARALAQLLPVASREHIPVLKTVRMDAADGVLTLATTDCDMYVQMAIEAVTTSEWHGCVDVKLLAGIASRADGELACSVEDGKLVVRYDSYTMALALYPASDFPSPLDAPSDGAAVSIAALRSVLAKVLPVVSDEAFRGYATQGVCLSINGDEQIEACATDGTRLSLVGHVDDAAVSALVPRKAAALLAKLLAESDAETLTFSQNDNLLGFQLGSTVMVTRKLDGKFPAFAAEMQGVVTPDMITLNHTAILTALDHLMFTCAGDPNAWQRWEIEPGKLTIRGRKQDVGTGETTIAIEYSGSSVVVGLKPVQILDCLRVADGETIDFAFDGNVPGGGACVFFRQPGYTYMVCTIQASFL